MTAPSGPSRVLVAALFALPLLLDAQQVKAPFTIHGYLTQAYGVSHGGKVTGLTSHGTADYRRAAVLARYDASPANSFVVQLAHRRLGDSPTMDFEEDVKLDMAFFEHRFQDGTKARIGKTVMPMGIYNEIRYAGILQPFYRAPLSMYWEGTYTSESIDGAMISHRFRAGKPWEISADVFGGSSTFLEFGTLQPDPAGPLVLVGGRMQAKNSFGTQLWLSTPLDGLRVGLSGRRHTDFGGIYSRPDGVEAKEFTASVDGTFEKLMVRGEHSQIRAQNVIVDAKYAQLGFRPIRAFSLNVQSEFMNFNVPRPAERVNVRMVRDNAVSLNLFPNAMSVFKVEAHSTRGFQIEEAVNIMGTPRRGSYVIGSFSVSF